MASNPANDTSDTTTLVDNSLVYVVIAIDTESDNGHPMGTLHTTFDVHNYLRVGSAACPRFVAKYSDNGSSWNSYTDGTAFNFKVIETSQTEPATSFVCGSNNTYGLADYAQAVRFTVPSTGTYNVQLQLSVTGNPPDTNIYVVPDLGGNPDIAHPLSTYTAHATSVINGSYTVIGSSLSLQAEVYYWWVANKQASGDDNNRFAIYQGVRSGSNTFSRVMDPDFRSSIVDSDGHPFKMSWFMEMDNFINNGFYADGRPMNYLTLYNELMNNWGTEVRSYGDEIAYHHHFMYWDGSQWIAGGHQHATDGQYEQHNYALNHMILDAQFFPTNFRAGWLNNDNQLQAWVEKWMLADVGGAGWGGTGWSPYHPSSTDFTQVGNMNHWIANCPTGPSQENVDAAFNQAVEENKAVLLCWYMHQRDDMRGLVASANTYLQNASSATGVPFEYVTAKEAMQAIIGATDTTPPTLSITRSTSNKYNIISNESLWGSGPYLAARYGEGTGAIYQRYATAFVKANTWRANIPSSNGGLPLKQVGAGALDLSGNSAVTFYIANQPPVAVADAYTTPEDTILSIAAPGVLANDTNANPTKPLSAIMVTAPGHGVATLNTNGSFTYTPGTDWNGLDSFTYKANDGTFDSNVATVSITVNAVDGSPVLDPIGNKTVDAGTLLGFTATASDDDPEATLSFTLSGEPAGATITSGGVFSWTPTGAQGPGTYTFDVCVSDGALSDCETITVTVLSQSTNVNVTVQLLDSSGNPLSGSVQYYDGRWKTFGSGTTPTSMALLAQTYVFRVNYAGAAFQKSQNVASNPVVSFQTGKVVSASGTATQYYTGVWRPFTNGMELLPRAYTFSFSGGVSNKQYRIIAGTTNTIY
jgi:hypothetical protein